MYIYIYAHIWNKYILILIHNKSTHKYVTMSILICIQILNAYIYIHTYIKQIHNYTCSQWEYTHIHNNDYLDIYTKYLMYIYMYAHI